MDDFWTAVNAQLDRIEAERPDTFAGVAAILDPIIDQGAIYGTPPGPGRAFFAGSGGDRSLWSALYAAGWRRTWIDADYYYTAEHPVTGAVLTYCEGDVFEGGAE